MFLRGSSCFSQGLKNKYYFESLNNNQVNAIHAVVADVVGFVSFVAVVLILLLLLLVLLAFCRCYCCCYN